MDTISGYGRVAWRRQSGHTSCVHLRRSTNLLCGPICKNVRSDNRIILDRYQLDNIERAKGVCGTCLRMVA
jgi:hypothetical protein